MRWLSILPKLFSEEHQKILKKFQSYLNDAKRLIKFDLERNQIVIVNNHELLHWRWNFTDINRLLYRIRMN
jgi:alpha-ketoglutarate-dependent taurine dioxygenase